MLALALWMTACNVQFGVEDLKNIEEIDLDSPEGAREGIDRLGIPFTVDSFVECARESDLVAVNLFLAAGMNPNAGNSEGVTALMAAKEGGHENIVKTLKKAGAKE